MKPANNETNRRGYSDNVEESSVRARRRMPVFYRVYLTLLVIFAAALAIGAFALNAWLAKYNEGIPETVSERFFETYFAKPDIDGILNFAGITPSEFETTEQLNAYVSGILTASPLSYTSISSGSDANVKKYIVKSGDYKVADFTLEKNADKIWQPATLTLHLPTSDKKEYRILDNSKLYLNGIEVTEKYILSREPIEAAAYLPEEVKAPEWVTYEIPNLTSVPEARIVDRNGNEPTLSEKDGIFCEDIVYDEPETALTEYLVKAAKQYAKCMQNDASKASVLQYFEKGTDLYNSIRTADNMFVWSHSGYEFKDEKVSEFFRYDENTVSVRIAFTHILKRAGSADYKDRTDITYFAHKTSADGNYLIFARYNN